MEGIGLDSILGAEEVEELFNNPVKEQESGTKEPDNKEEKKNEIAEPDFSDLLGKQVESVGNENNKEGTGETPKSDNDSGTPQTNPFSSIAKALKEEGVFPDLSDDIIKSTKDAASFKKLFDDEIAKSLDERQKRIEEAINGGATSEDIRIYQNNLNISKYLEDSATIDTLSKEGDEGEELRKKIMYQDYINRGFKHEKAVRMVEKSISDATDMEDAKEAYESCREYYSDQIKKYQNSLKEQEKQKKDYEEQQYSNLKKQILDKEEFYGGVKVDKTTRQKAYDTLTKPVFKDEAGNYLTALQKYQRENPMEFMVNMALMMTLTDNFKNLEGLTKGKINAGLKKGFAELESIINTTRRNGDGTLNLANAAPDESDREKWELAL